MTDGARGGKLRLENLWVLMVTAFVDMVGFALVLPLLPLYAKDFGADATTAGMLLGSFALAQLFTGPLWGRASDRYGRRPVILWGQALSAVAFVAFAFADDVWLLLLSRLAQGAGGGTLSANQAYVADTVGPDERAKALGWITACTSAGFMVGPGIASLTVRWSLAAPGLIAAGLCVLNILFAWRWLPESTSPERRAALAEKPRTPLLPAILDVVRHPGAPVATLIAVYAGGMLAFTAVSGMMAWYLSDVHGVTKESIGGYYVALGAISVVMRALILGILVQRFGEVRTLRLGTTFLIAGLAVAPFAADPWIFLAAILAVPTGTALLFPCTTSLISRYADPDVVGQTHGVQQAFGGTSRLLGPIWAGLAYDTLGARFPFWIGAGMMALVLLSSFRFRPGEAPEKDEADEVGEKALEIEEELSGG